MYQKITMAISGVIKFFSMRAVEGAVAILLITFMPNLPPDAKYSLNYDLTPVLPFEGPLTLNHKLQGAQIWHKGDFHGPEAFAVYNGELYTTIHGGNVVKLIGDNVAPVVKFGKMCKGFYEEHICGRPLGMQFDKNGILYVADAYYGIFKVDVKTGKQVQLVSMDEEINGKKPKLPNSVAVASNGDVFWTDSSTEFYLYDGIYDMLADGSGRVIHYDAKNKKNTVLIDKVHFANGIRLAADESFVIITETARCRVHRYYLKGPKKGTHDIFLDGLPGLPDNIQTDGKDGFIIPLVVGRDDDHPPPLNIFGPFPLTRKFFSRIMGLTELGFKVIDQIYPTEWAERAIHYIGHFASLPHSLSSGRQTVLHVSKNGEILDSIHSLDKSIIGMSEAFIFKDMLYMGSPFNDYVARIPLSKVGWEHLTLKETDYPFSQPSDSIKTTGFTTEEPKLSNAPITDAPKMATPQPTQAPRVVTQHPTTHLPKPTPKEEVHVHKREVPPAAIPKSAPQVTTPPPSQKPATAAPTQKPSTPAPSPAPKATATPPAPKPTTPTPAPKPTVATPAPTQKPVTAAPSPTPAPKQAAPAPAPAAKPATPAPPSVSRPAAPAPSPAPKQAAPAPSSVPKPAASASQAAPKPAVPAPQPAAPTPSPAPKPATPAPSPAPKPAAPAPSTAPKPAAPASSPTPKQAAPALKPAAPAPKPAAPAPPPSPKPSVPAPPPPQPKPSVPATQQTPSPSSAPAPQPKQAASGPSPVVPQPAPSQPPKQSPSPKQESKPDQKKPEL